ncbi:MAG: peptidylprolyl isomerase [Acidobacteriota bacterium]
MTSLTKGLILVVAILLIGAGLVVWKKKAGGEHGTQSFNSISRQEIETLIGDIAKKNPMAIKRLAQNPEMKTKQLDSLKQLLAFASEAQKEGLADDPSNKQELKSIRAEVTAVNYDQEINKDKGQMPQLGFITDDQIQQYWNDPSAGPAAATFWDKIGLGSHDEQEAGTKEEQFQAFLDSKLKLLKSENPQFSDDQVTDEDKKQAHDYFAKVQIYKNEYNNKIKSGELSDEFRQKTDLQVKLQQAQFLMKLYADKMADQAKVTDDEVNQYIASHPELNPTEKRNKAVEILNRAKAGEDFATLANENTEDPGNVNSKGEKQGGLYKDIQKGKMVKPFEEAALALEPGQISPDVVESDFGFHIIKLEKKTEGKDASGNPTVTYDARHILISTTFKDPKNPTAQPMPTKEYAKQQLSVEKQKKIVDDLVAKNNISVPDDYTLPEISDQQIQDMMKNQPQNPMGGPPPGADTDGPTPPPAKGAPKKLEPKKK